MTSRRAVCSVVLAAAWCGGVASAPCHAGTTRQQPNTVPSATEMEADLLLALNAERAARNLQAVCVLPELAELARRHSAEMARRDVFSHDSESGKSYRQRLTEAGIASVASGENLSRSNSFATRLIHESLMNSPPHRENMLNPAYDAVGIGVASRRGETYFVTMDFIKRVPRKSGADIRTMMLGALNDARAKANLARFLLIDDVNRMADELAEAKASGGDVPGVPLIGKRSTAFFVTGVDLDRMVASVGDLEVKEFGRGGIGSAFSRSRQYPDGTYVVCIILVWDGS